MVLLPSVRIPRVPTYSGFLLASDWPFVYGAFTLFDRIFQFSSTRSSVHFSQVLTRHIFLYVVWALPISLATTFGIVFYFLFLRVIRCFSSPGSLRITIYSLYDTITLLMVSFLIRISADLRLFATPRRFSQLVTSFFGAMYQGILLYALCSLFLFRSFASFFLFRELSVELSLNTLQKKFFNSRLLYFFVLTSIVIFIAFLYFVFSITFLLSRL